MIGRTNFPTLNLALNIKSLEKMQLGDGLVAGSYIDSKRKVLVDFIGLVVELDHKTSTARVIWTPKSVRLQISEYEIAANSWNELQLFKIDAAENSNLQFRVLFSELIAEYDAQGKLSTHEAISEMTSIVTPLQWMNDSESTVDMLAEGIFWILHSSKRVMNVEEIAKTVNANTGIVRQLLVKNNLILFKQLDYSNPANWARNWTVNWVAIENRSPLPGIDYEEYITSRRHSKEIFKIILIDYFSNKNKSVKVTTISKDLNIFKDEIQMFLDLAENHQVFRKFGSYNYQLKNFRIPLVREKKSKQKSRNHATHATKPQISQLGNPKSIVSHRIRRPNVHADLSSFFVIPNRQEKLAKLENEIEKTIQLVVGESLLRLDLESIKSRTCSNCDEECSDLEKSLSIFCSQKCVKDAEQRYLKQFTNDHKLKFKTTKSPNTITEMMVEGNGAEISVVNAIEIVVNWLVFDSGQNVSDSSIWVLIDEFKKRNISYIDETKIDGLTVLDQDLVELLIDLDRKLYSENEYRFPLQTDSVIELLSKYSLNHEVRQFIRVMNGKEFLNSIKFIDRFTLCYFGAPSEVLEAVGERIFIDTDRLKSWISRAFEDKSEELHQFADEICFASSCMDFWPNMSILVYPWIDFDPGLASREVIEKRYLSRLVLSITKSNSNSKSQMLQWMRELVFFYFELEASKARTARGRYSETFQVSRERARQISHASKPLLDYLRRLEKERHDVGLFEAKDRLSQYIRSHPGSTQNELVELFGANIKFRKWFDQNHAHLILVELDSSSEIAPDSIREDVLESLREASTMSWPLSSKSYSDLLISGFVSGVTSQRILQIFGTWKNACDEAGVECGETRREDYTRDFSRDECLKFVCDYLMDENHHGTSQGYMSWRENHQTPDRVPSFGTLRNRIDRYWATIARLALVELRAKWFEIGFKELSNEL